MSHISDAVTIRKVSITINGKASMTGDIRARRSENIVECHVVCSRHHADDGTELRSLPLNVHEIIKNKRAGYYIGALWKKEMIAAGIVFNFIKRFLNSRRIVGGAIPFCAPHLNIWNFPGE